MLNSMTGYGCAKGASGTLDITVEMKSVNNRYFDCTVRLPRGYAAVEDPVKTLIQNTVSRGKIEVYVTVDTSRADDIVIKVNEPLADAYRTAYETLAQRENLRNDLTASILSRFPDIFLVEKKEMDMEAIGRDICAVTEKALADFCAMRRREGEKLHGDLLSCLERVEMLTGMVEERSPKTVEEYRRRLEDRIRQVLEDRSIDEARIVTEAAIFADKVAVAEETVRMRSHIAQFRLLLEEDVPVGKKCDFLVQEMNREANTMGSKGNDAEIAKIVVDLKSEIEKIREQIQNVE